MLKREDELERLLRQREAGQGLEAGQAALVLWPSVQGRWPASQVALLRGLAGVALLRTGRHDEARPHLVAAFESDPTDRETAAALGRLATEAGDRALAARAFEALLINHRDELTEHTLRTVLQQVAQHYLAEGDWTRAQDRVDEALELDGHHAGLLRLRLEVAEAAGEMDRVPGLRERLIAALPEGAEKAGLLVRHAGWLERRGRSREAGLARVACWRMGGPREEAERALRDLQRTDAREEEWALWQALADDAEGARAVEVRLSWAERLLGMGDHVRAAETLLTAWALDPSRLSLLERAAALLTAARDWRALHDVYARSIATLRELPGNERVQAGLWRSLAEVCRLHLSAPDEALVAWGEVCRLDPGLIDPQAVLTSARASQDAGIATRVLHAVWSEDGSLAELGELLGALWLRGGETDRGRVVLQTVALCGDAMSAAARASLDRLQVGRPSGSADGPLHSGWRAAYLSEGMDWGPIRACFRVAWALAGERFARTLEDWEVEGRRHRIREDGLLLMNLLAETCDRLGWETVPEVYESTRVDHIQPAWTLRPALLVHPGWLGSRDAEDLRCLLARQLVLMEPDATLAVLCSGADAQRLLALLVHQADPARFAMPQGPWVPEVARMLQRALPQQPAWGQALRLAVGQLERQPGLADVPGFQQALVSEAHRTAWLACDDLARVVGWMQASPLAGPLGGPESQAMALRRWALSEQASTARARAGR